jgi:hypothetical protein
MRKQSGSGGLAVVNNESLTGGAAVPASLEDRFQALVRQWKDATALSSSVRAAITHPAYLQIIGMGAPAVPFILRELQREPDHWFHALLAVTGEDAAAGQETFAGAVAAWLEWGRSRGYLGPAA